MKELSLEFVNRHEHVLGGVQHDLLHFVRRGRVMKQRVLARSVAAGCNGILPRFSLRISVQPHNDEVVLVSSLRLTEMFHSTLLFENCAEKWDGNILTGHAGDLLGDSLVLLYWIVGMG